MITREDLNGKNQQELQSLLEKSVAEFQAEAQIIETEEKVLEKEQEIMGMMDEYQKYISNIQYDLPDNCLFEGQQFNKNKVSSLIIGYIETQEVQWDYVSGLYDLCKLWKDDNTKSISYGAYDSTLRILGSTVKYKGLVQWRNLLIINEFLSACHEEYIKDASYQIYLSHCHNILLDQMKTFHPNEEMVVE